MICKVTLKYKLKMKFYAYKNELSLPRPSLQRELVWGQLGALSVLFQSRVPSNYLYSAHKSPYNVHSYSIPPVQF